MAQKPHLLNRILPVALRNRLRELALRTIPSMRHLDMPRRLAHLKALGFEPRSIVDVGAHWGDWARVAAKVWPRARILGVEPNPDDLPHLEQTRRDVPSFDFRQGLLGPERRTVKFRSESHQTSLLAPVPGESEALQTAEMWTLDELLAQAAFGPPQLIKLDVQGYELEVLRGASHALSQCEAVLAEVSMFRFFPGMPLADEVIQFMRERGFVWYDVAGIYRRKHDDALGQMDLLFVREDHPLRASSAW
jgi:FkbM family methyltransferase